MGALSEQLAVELARWASDYKCEDITVMDLRERSSVTDFFVICSGTSDRQMRSTSDALVECSAKLGTKPYGRSGYHHAAWILIDFVDVVVHLFMPDHRRYYDLELLWGDAPRIDWRRLVTN